METIAFQPFPLFSGMAQKSNSPVNFCLQIFTYIT